VHGRKAAKVEVGVPEAAQVRVRVVQEPAAQVPVLRVVREQEQQAERGPEQVRTRAQVQAVPLARPEPVGLPEQLGPPALLVQRERQPASAALTRRKARARPVPPAQMARESGLSMQLVLALMLEPRRVRTPRTVKMV